MKKSSFATITTDEVVSKYVNAALGQEAAIMRGNRKEADRQHAIATRAYEELSRRSERGRIVSLLNHDAAVVRGWAAAHALRFNPDAAIPVLEHLLEHAVGIASLNAHIALQLWREGKIPKDIG